MASSNSTPLTSIDSMNSQIEKVVPTADQSKFVRGFSKELWQGLAAAARSLSFGRNTIDLGSLIKHGPKMPDDMEGTTELTGFASWEITEEPQSLNHPLRVSPHGPRTGLKRRWNLMKLQPTSCEISGHSSFQVSDSESNGLAFMFLAWSYILCVFLLEEQRIPVIYEDAAAPSGDETPTSNEFIVDLGDASNEEYRWWSTLLSPGQGWKATRFGHPVWAVSFTGNVKFKITYQRSASKPSGEIEEIKPPTSKEAAEFLSRFASLYNLESQAVLGLAMALIVPLHQNMSSTIHIPKPHLAKPSTVSLTSIIDKEFRNLSYYMALSSNPTFVASALWSVFWEPEVDCNLVTPWFDPIIDVLLPLIEDENLEMVGHMLALRRPGVAPLWYGLLACGTTETVLAIVPYLKTLNTRVPTKLMPEVAVWTDSPQSFMDLTGSGPYLQGSQISRADAWRLRHECCNAWKDGAHFRYLPTTPFRPFGSINGNELEVVVRKHLECSRHQWTYKGFTWVLRTNVTLLHEPRVLTTPWTDFEEDSVIQPPRRESVDPNYEPDHAASQRAVGDMFRWAATEMEASGKHIYSHPWVDINSHFVQAEKAKKRGNKGMMRLSELLMERVKEWNENREEDDETVVGAGEV
ncbi:uncharacterized protein TrAFT101_000908 [Trichoderma asperellum]|uniref:uncharacterized protein n=1 Tax=Trichoderma asperellum TaxID=101201 RepID=UPI0033270F5B|nr:hypothetical protein TrAFT101_000908 [Trichoderma asperellum]